MRIALTYWLVMAFCGAGGSVANRDDTDTVPAVALAILVAGAVALDVVVCPRAEAAGMLKRQKASSTIDGGRLWIYITIPL